MYKTGYRSVQSVQSGVGRLSCNKTALKRCTSTETLRNRKAPSLSSPEDEEIFLPKLPKSWHADVFIIIIIIIIKGIYIAQVRKGHKCAMSAEMAVWLGYVTVYVSIAIYITNCQDSQIEMSSDVFCSVLEILEIGIVKVLFLILLHSLQSPS